jgi:protein lifeguard
LYVVSIPSTTLLRVHTSTGVTGLVGIFIPFSRGLDLVFAIGGCLLFSGYIVYDTYIINSRLSPDEYIIGAISLYLEYVSFYTSLFSRIDEFVSSFINLFLNILRLLNDLQER